MAEIKLSRGLQGLAGLVCGGTAEDERDEVVFKEVVFEEEVFEEEAGAVLEEKIVMVVTGIGVGVREEDAGAVPEGITERTEGLVWFPDMTGELLSVIASGSQLHPRGPPLPCTWYRIACTYSS